MPRSREAISTIKGYYYQFDYYILRLLYLQGDNSAVCIEGVEDVDVITDETTEAVQCKYYEGTRCTPSAVGEAVRPMLRHFSDHKESQMYRYKLYGHYKSGQNSIPDDFDLDYAKKHFFTFTEKNKVHALHDELGLTDADITEFLGRLELQLDANSYDEQYEEIISQIQKVIGCTDYDARFFYYNNAVAFVKKVAVKKTRIARTISKEQFLAEVGKKRELFDKWYIEFIGYEKYYRAARKEFFTVTNVSPINRFFLMECDACVTDTDLAELIMEISIKWSKNSKREPSPFCPYIYLQGLTDERLMNVKKLLVANEFYFWDGHDYKGAAFSSASLVRPINDFLGIRAKIINKKNEIDTVISECNNSKAVFEFYTTKPFYDRTNIYGKEFQIMRTMDVKKIV